MSTKKSWLLYLEPEAWQLARELGEEDSSSERISFRADALAQQGESIAKALREAGYASEPLVVGLDARLCLPATIDVTSPQMLRKPQVLHYQLEEWIPWSAEEFVSDYVGHKNQAFMVAARHADLAMLLKDLESDGVIVAAIAPITLLAFEEHSIGQLPTNHLLLWQDGEQIDVIKTQQGQPWHWSRIPAIASEVVRMLQIEAPNETALLPVFIRNFSDGLQSELTDQDVDMDALEAVDQLTAAYRACQSIGQGQLEAAINLQQGELAGQNSHNVLSKEFSWLKIAAALLMVGIGVGLWIRSEKYTQATVEKKTELAVIYQDLFPNKKVPPRIGDVIKAQHRILQGTRVPSTDLPNPTAADLVLQQILQHLPKDMRFRVPEIHIEQDHISLGGEVRSNGDADRIASALRAHGFQVDPPRTQRLAEQGFAVRLNAQVATSDNTSKSK